MPRAKVHSSVHNVSGLFLSAACVNTAEWKLDSKYKLFILSFLKTDCFAWCHFKDEPGRTPDAVVKTHEKIRTRNVLVRLSSFYNSSTPPVALRPKPC